MLELQFQLFFFYCERKKAFKMYFVLKISADFQRCKNGRTTAQGKIFYVKPCFFFYYNYVFENQVKKIKHLQMIYQDSRFSFASTSNRGQNQLSETRYARLILHPSPGRAGHPSPRKETRTRSQKTFPSPYSPNCTKTVYTVWCNNIEKLDY